MGNIWVLEAYYEIRDDTKNAPNFLSVHGASAIQVSIFLFLVGWLAQNPKYLPLCSNYHNKPYFFLL